MITKANTKVNISNSFCHQEKHTLCAFDQVSAHARRLVSSLPRPPDMSLRKRIVDFAFSVREDTAFEAYRGSLHAVRENTGVGTDGVEERYVRECS